MKPSFKVFFTIIYDYLLRISILQSTGHLISWTNIAIDAVLTESPTHNNLISSKIEIKPIEIEEEIKLKHLSLFIYISLTCLSISFI